MISFNKINKGHMGDNTIKKSNELVNLMRIICAYMVLAIHVHPGEDISHMAYLIASNIIPRLGVPFFFSIAGYYYIKSMLEERSNFKKYMLRLLVTYSFWSVIYIAFKLSYSLYTNTFEPTSFLLESVKSFFITGSFYHLWFFPALIFAVLLSTLANKLGLLKYFAYFSLILYALGLCITSYYGLAQNIPFIKRLVETTDYILIRRMFFMNISFFMAGYFLNLLKNTYSKVKNKHMIIGIILLSILELTEIYIVTKTGISKTFLLTFFLYPLLMVIIMFLLNNPMQGRIKHADKFKRISGFIFYSHPLFIPFIRDYFDVPQTKLYFIMVIILAILGYLVSKINNKFLDRVL
jgi:surface polysaccharide O-acyltransferase-like enzyme